VKWLAKPLTEKNCNGSRDGTENNEMSNRKVTIGIVGIVALVGGWYAFRPERLFINQSVSESFPTASAAAAPVELASGRFRGVAHESKGIATLYQQPDGKRVLRLTEFQTSNGPQLHVYLVAAADATDNDTVKNAGFVDLGDLKGNQGDQNYEVPASVDLSKYRAVTVWCQRFGVNFATASLSMQGASVGEPKRVAAGSFRSVAHESKGVASIYQLADGKQVLRLTEFKTSNGPDLQLYLVAAEDAKDSDTVKNAGFVTLGALKGNEGDQNYEIPAGTDLNKYRAVTVWCRRFGVNFATAPLVKQ
jgi:hypothetical protein